MDKLDEFRIKNNGYNAFFGSFVASHAIKDSLVFLACGIGCKRKATVNTKEVDFNKDFTNLMGWSEFAQEDLVSGNLKKIKANILGQIKRDVKIGFIPIIQSPVIKTIDLDIQSYIDKNKSWFKGLPVKFVNNPGVDSCFWQGYFELMKSFLEIIDWNRRYVQKKTLNVFGYPFYRYESDDINNTRVLKLLLKNIGLDLQTIFFSGKFTKDMINASKAQLNIILPFASRIGKDIKKITNRKNIYTDMPLGLNQTSLWLKRIAKIYDLEKKAENYIEQEVSKRKDILNKEKIKNKNKKVALILDTPYIPSMCSFFEEIGFEISFIVPRDKYYQKNSSQFIKKLLESNEIKSIDKILIDTYYERNHINYLIDKKKPDLIICSYLEKVHIPKKYKTFSFGFPNNDKHYVDEIHNDKYPHKEYYGAFLGFEGFDNLLFEINELFN